MAGQADTGQGHAQQGVSTAAEPGSEDDEEEGEIMSMGDDDGAGIVSPRDPPAGEERSCFSAHGFHSWMRRAGRSLT